MIPSDEIVIDDSLTERDVDRPAPPVPVKDDERRSGWPSDLPGKTPGYLQDKAVYLSQCHGYIWYDVLDSFSTQRGNLFDTVEDIHNPEGMNQFLTAYLENAGAAVFTAKERDQQRAWAIVDDGDAGYAESGSGFVNGPPGFLQDTRYNYGENPFAIGSTRRFPADGGASVTWTPSAPADGYYAIYVTWDSDSLNAPDAHYTFTHPGGVIDRVFNQTVHGSTWQYVDTLWLPAGNSLTVKLVGDSSATNRWLSADAVRIGGGSGVVARNGEVTGRPRYEEGAILATQFNGAPTSVYDPYGDGNGSDPSSRSRWADWEHPSGEDAIYLSWHSNACDSCGARGTSTYTYASSGCASGPPVAGSVDLADVVQDEIVSMATLSWDSGWVDRGTRTDCFAENNPSNNDEMPSALIELAFHDTAEDVAFLKHPAFRRDAARAMYRGIVRYYADRDGETPHYLPEPPSDLALLHGPDGRLVLSWEPGPSGFPDGDPATAYRVYTSRDGQSWDSGQAVTGTSFTLDTDPGDAIYARVAATNAGGASFPSEVVAARRSPDGQAPVLIVAAFDRLDTGMLDYETLPSVGEVVKMDVTKMNAGDIAATHGRSVAALGWPFETVSDERFDGLDVSDYGVIVWATGEESTLDETFSTAQQAKVQAFWSAGGALFVTGAEILWDLDYKGTNADRAFANTVLGATMQADDAATDDATGTGLLAGLDLGFGVVEGGAYPVEYPDVLTTTRTKVVTYSNGSTAGALGERVFMLGFPFETIVDPSVRDEVMARVLGDLLPDYVPTPVDTDTNDTNDTSVPDTNDTDVASPGAGGPGTMVARDGLGCGCGSVGGARGLGLLAVALLARRRRTHV